MTPLRQLYEVLMLKEPDAAMLWEDDMLFTKQGLKELRGHFEFFEFDRYEVESKFHWDNALTYNASFPEHWSAILWRCYPGDRHSPVEIQHAPEAVQRSDAVCRLTHPLRNFGYMRKDDRKMQFERAKEFGRLDNHIFTLVRDPVLKPWKNKND